MLATVSPQVKGDAKMAVEVTELLVTVLLLAAALFVILSKRYDAKDKHWVYTTVGIIIGFWLKSSTPRCTSSGCSGSVPAPKYSGGDRRPGAWYIPEDCPIMKV